MKKFKLLQGKEVIGTFDCVDRDIAVKYFSIIKKLTPEQLLGEFKVVEVEV